MTTLNRAFKLLTGTLAAMASSAALAIGTPAGTEITNTASATFDLPGGTTGLTKSAEVKLNVLELINVNVTSQNSGNVSTIAGATDQVLTYVVTNTGNGAEDFEISLDQLTSDDFDALNVRLYKDTDGNGTYTPGTDTLLTSGSSSIGLTADDDQTIFILIDIPNTGSEAAGDISQLKLSAISETVVSHGGASPAPGDLMAGVGSGGANDAVIGNSYTDAATGALEIGTGAGSATVNMTKTVFRVVDPFGGSSMVPGSIITYQIDATVANGSVDNLVISDELPGELTYKANSIVQIDTLTSTSTPLTDTATDADAGSFDSAAGSNGTVFVTLGTQAAGASFRVQLQAEIK
tara:strand:- start:536 stop:1585 length:1050 start_codon:yes stop_codon:yes gene_type:complete